MAGMSRPRAASTIPSPMPGRANVVSMTTAPKSRNPTLRASTEMVGGAALRSTKRRISLGSDRPIERPVAT